MPSLIFSTMARVLFWMMLVVSILVLLRGHNQPGGGFVGGLVAAMALGLVALADGVERAKHLARAHPVSIIGLGVLLGLLGGLPGLLLGGGFLEHQWLVFDNGFKFGTTMIFDLGVYFVVLGGMLALIFRLYESPK